MSNLLKILHRDGLMTTEEAVAFRNICRNLNEKPVRLLRSLNIASPEQIQGYFQRYFRFDILKESSLQLLGKSHRDLIPKDLALHYSCFGLGEKNNRLYVAVEDPLDKGTLTQLSFFLGQKISPVCATVFQLTQGLTKIYDVSLSELKLSTNIDKSRGVIGGVRYQDSYVDWVKEDFVLSIKKSRDVLHTMQTPTSDAKLPESLAPQLDTKVTDEKIEIKNETTQTSTPVFEFIDGSSGNVDPELLKIEDPKVTEPTAPQEEIKVIEEMKIQEAPILTEEVKAAEEPKTETPEQTLPINPELEQKLISVTSQAFVKLSLMNNRSQSLEMFNELLKPLELKIEIQENDKFKIIGKNLQFEGDLSNKDLENQNMKNHVYETLHPIIKKIFHFKSSQELTSQ